MTVAPSKLTQPEIHWPGKSGGRGGALRIPGRQDSGILYLNAVMHPPMIRGPSSPGERNATSPSDSSDGAPS